MNNQDYYDYFNDNYEYHNNYYADTDDESIEYLEDLDTHKTTHVCKEYKESLKNNEYRDSYLAIQIMKKYFWEHPDEDSILERIRTRPSCFKHIPSKLLTHDACILAVELESQNIKYFNQIICDANDIEYTNICKLALDSDADLLGNMEQSDELINYAISKNPNSIHHVRQPTDDHYTKALIAYPTLCNYYHVSDDILKRVFKENVYILNNTYGRKLIFAVTQEEIKTTVERVYKKNPLLLKKLLYNVNMSGQNPEEFNNKIKIFIDTYPPIWKSILQYCDICGLLTQIPFDVIKKSLTFRSFVGSGLDYILSHIKNYTEKLGNVIVKGDSTFWWILDNDKIVEIFGIALQTHGNLICKIPHEYLTTKLAEIAVKNTPGALGYIPSKFQTESMCWRAIKHNNAMVMYVKINSDHIFTWAVENECDNIMGYRFLTQNCYKTLVREYKLFISV